VEKCYYNLPKMVNMKQKACVFFLSCFFSLFLLSCSDDDNNGGLSEQEKTEYINGWIYNNMEVYYFWNQYLPQNVDKSSDPELFFSSLLYEPDTKDGDRFSWIQKNYIDLLNALSGYSSSEMGFDYQFIQYERNGPVYARVLYVKTGTAAEKNGLKRGMDIATVNGSAMTVDNYQSVLKSNLSNYKLGVISSTGGSTIEYKPDADYAENPVYLDTIYDFGTKKIGYLVYNFFARGRNNETYEYDEELMNVLSRFKTEGVNNLVLDLRYNSGGAVSSATCLASALVPSRKTTDVFVNYEYNSFLSARLSNSDKYEYFTDKVNDRYDIPRLGDQLENVYIITGKRSASASELIINGLNPFMEDKILRIGETTYGKNVASITLIETKAQYKEINKCGLQPIVSKLSNSAGFSDYVDGFAPHYPIDEIWEADTMYQLGDEREILLSKAFDLILDRTRSIQKRSTTQGISIKNRFSDERNYNMYIDSGKFMDLKTTE